MVILENEQQAEGLSMFTLNEQWSRTMSRRPKAPAHVHVDPAMVLDDDREAKGALPRLCLLELSVRQGQQDSESIEGYTHDSRHARLFRSRSGKVNTI